MKEILNIRQGLTMSLYQSTKNQEAIIKALLKSLTNIVDKRIKPLNNELINDNSPETMEQLIYFFNEPLNNIIERIESNFQKIYNNATCTLHELETTDKSLNNIRLHVPSSKKIDDFVCESIKFTFLLEELIDILGIANENFDITNNRKLNLSEQIKLAFKLIFLMINSIKRYISVIVQSLSEEKLKV